MADPKKGIKEDLARFLESPARDTLREFLKNHLGEANECDFKETLPSSAKLAKHILAFGNQGGGVIFVGISDTKKGFVPKGLDCRVDKAEIARGIERFIPHTLHGKTEILDFHYPSSEYPALAGKAYQTIIVSTDPSSLPFVSLGEGEGIRKNAIYVRRGTASEEANYEELQGLLSRRIETMYSSLPKQALQGRLEELRLLYNELDQALHLRIHRHPILSFQYPIEGLGSFLIRQIRRKKREIAIQLGDDSQEETGDSLEFLGSPLE